MVDSECMGGMEGRFLGKGDGTGRDGRGLDEGWRMGMGGEVSWGEGHGDGTAAGRNRWSTVPAVALLTKSPQCDSTD
jgi:hypothetical protein